MLDAAERVFAGAQPDRVGLKEVAREAGVSHALITHYFGTYHGLVEAALERRIRKLRESMLVRLQDAGAVERPEELLAMLFDALADPVHLRLTRWMFASERPSASYTFAFRERGLQLMSQQIANALVVRPSKALVDKLEMAMLAAVSAAYGYAMGKYALASALGREATPELDRAVQKTIAEMLRAHLQHELVSPSSDDS